MDRTGWRINQRHRLLAELIWASSPMGRKAVRAGPDFDGREATPRHQGRTTNDRGAAIRTRSL